MTYEFKIELDEEQVTRLKRLHFSGNWQVALQEHIDQLVAVKAGTPTITSASQYPEMISGPSNAARYQ